jgi:hypothetical protein
MLALISFRSISITSTDVDGNLMIMAEQVRRAIAWLHMKLKTV